MNERFEGIVLFKRPHREHDALVKIFTASHGTKMFFVRGANRPNHPLAGQLIPLTHHEWIGDIHDEGLSFLKEGQTLNYYTYLQQDIVAQAYAAYVSQLVDAAVEDNRPDVVLYHLLQQALAALDKKFLPEIVAVYCELHLLSRFGTHIQWDCCVECHRSLEPFSFSITKHGVLCPDHAVIDSHRLPISGRTIHIAAQLVHARLDAIQTVNVSRRTLDELRQLMDIIYQEFVGIRLKSRSYLDQLMKMQQNMADLRDKKN